MLPLNLIQKTIDAIGRPVVAACARARREDFRAELHGFQYSLPPLLFLCDGTQTRDYLCACAQAKGCARQVHLTSEFAGPPVAAVVPFTSQAVTQAEARQVAPAIAPNYRQPKKVLAPPSQYADNRVMVCKIHCLIFLIVGALAACTTSAPREPATDIISAAQWGGTPANETLARPHAISRITLHHQGGAFPRDRDPQQYLRELQSWSRGTKGWIDVPYHYIIDLDGRIYQGRDIGYAGDTNTRYDPLGHALIEVVGNFEEVEPNGAQLDATASLMAQLAWRYDVPLENIRGHRDYADTTCPGKNLYRYLENGYFHAQVRTRLAGRNSMRGKQ